MKLKEAKQAVFDLARIIDTDSFREMFPELAAVYNLRFKQSWLEILAALKAESREWLRAIWVATMQGRERKRQRRAKTFERAGKNLSRVLHNLVEDLDPEQAMVAMAQAAASVTEDNETLEYAEAEAHRVRDRDRIIEGDRSSRG